MLLNYRNSVSLELWWPLHWSHLLRTLSKPLHLIYHLLWQRVLSTRLRDYLLQSKIIRVEFVGVGDLGFIPCPEMDKLFQQEHGEYVQEFLHRYDFLSDLPKLPNLCCPKLLERLFWIPIVEIVLKARHKLTRPRFKTNLIFLQSVRTIHILTISSSVSSNDINVGVSWFWTIAELPENISARQNKVLWTFTRVDELESKQND